VIKRLEEALYEIIVASDSQIAETTTLYKNYHHY
jgi:hypothetical protein